MTYCNTTSLNISPHIQAGFPSTNTLMCSMRQVFRDRANDAGPQDNILQTPSARFVALCRRFCCPRKTWCGRRDFNPQSYSLDAFAGIDVAFAKVKRLPVVLCAFRGSRFEPLTEREQRHCCRRGSCDILRSLPESGMPCSVDIAGHL
jgi:hypothetical protein